MLDITPESVLSSPVTEGVGVNWELFRELAGELVTAVVVDGGRAFRASMSLWTAPRNWT